MLKFIQVITNDRKFSETNNHLESNGTDQDENICDESFEINEETPLVKSTPPISPTPPKSSQIIRKPPRSPASPQNSRPVSMGPPNTPIKENGIRGRRLGAEDLEVSNSNKLKENERMQKASSSSNILDSSNSTGLFLT